MRVRLIPGAAWARETVIEAVAAATSTLLVAKVHVQVSAWATRALLAPCAIATWETIMPPHPV